MSEHTIKSIRKIKWLDRVWVSVDFIDSVPPGLFLPMAYAHLKPGDVINYDNENNIVQNVRVKSDE